MAKAWTMAEAVKAIHEGDKAAINDIGGRFPLFANLAAQVNDAAVELIGFVPEIMTARKVEAQLKAMVGDVEEEAPVEEKSVEKKRGRKPAKKVEELEEADDEEEEDEEPVPKKRGRKPVKKAVKKVEPDEDEEEEDSDEDEDEEEEVKPRKRFAKKPAAKVSKKPVKKVEEDEEEDEEEDDDDDFDFD